MAHHPAISVCMPMYNASRYLRECIDSVLAQTFTDFEFLIADDGSTDNSVEIVESYSDPRIRLIKREHDYIATLNCLIDEARGEYIARMDADDIMFANRLEVQYTYMTTHPNIDVLGGEMIMLDENEERKVSVVNHISMWEMIDTCCLAHPTTLFRRSTLRRYNIHYRTEYVYAEDYALWIELLQLGCVLHNIPTPLVKYRISESQISVCNQSEQQAKTKLLRQEACNWLVSIIYEQLDNTQPIEDCKSSLSVIIPFLNEGEEITNTVSSIRANSFNKDITIIVIDDCSSDGIDYKSRLSPYNVKYFRNNVRMGAALSKERGVRFASSKYFIILDAHMRVFTPNWDSLLLSNLSKNPHAIFCCKTVPIKKGSDGSVIIDSSPDNKAAFLTFRDDKYIPSIRWNERPNDYIPGLSDNEICAILGACYASSKEYWNLITGMQGLLHFGCEEACLSIKSWLWGGGCRYIQDIVFGHIYRNTSNYYFSKSGYLYNYLAIGEMLFPYAENCWCRAIMRQNEPYTYERILCYISANNKLLKSIHSHFKSACESKFQRIIDINANASAIHNEHFIKLGPLMADIVLNLSTVHDSICKPGLLDGGACGKLLFLLEYTAVFGEQESINVQIKDLFAIVRESIETRTANWTLHSGLAGIGIGLLYMMENNLIDDNLTDLLDTIDYSISQYSPSRLPNKTYKDGLGGLCCYVVNRLIFNNNSHKLNKEFLLELCQAGEKQSLTNNDFRSSSYFAQLSAFISDKPIFLPFRPICMADIITTNRVIPTNPDYWFMKDNNILGYAIELLYLKRQKNRYEKECL